MRGADITQAALFSYRTLEQRIPKNHPLRKFRVVVDAMLASMDAELDALYAPTGRDSIPPERLLRASLIQTLFSIRSERQLVTHIDYNLLYRWFVGLGMDEAVWNHSTFSANREESGSGLASLRLVSDAPIAAYTRDSSCGRGANGASALPLHACALRTIHGNIPRTRSNATLPSYRAL